MPVLSCLGCVLLLAATPSAAPTLAVRGDVDCPTTSEVSAALVGLVARQNPSAASDVVELSGRGAAVAVKLVNGSKVIAVKRLPATLSCADRARAAAVIVAAWEVRLHPGVRPLLPVLSTPLPRSQVPTEPSEPIAVPPLRLVSVSPLTPTPTPTPGPTAPPSLPAPSVAPSLPPTAQQARNAGDAEGAVTAHVPAEAASPIDIETGAAILASATAGTFSPAVMLEATLARRNSRFAIGISGLAVGQHTTTVGSGKGAWRRLGGVVDVRSISRWRTLELEIQLGLALTALEITGQSLPVTSAATIFDPGVLGGVRSRFRPGRLSPWVQATVALWPRSHDLYVTGTTNSYDLSAFEALLGFGFSLGPDR